jgi:hypothetical protein
MSFSTLHDFFQTQSPHGVGLALTITELEAKARSLVQRLSFPHASINDNVQLPQFPRIGFSFLVDPATFHLQPGGLLSVSITIWLHPFGHSNQPIMTQTLSVTNSQIKVGADPTTGNLTWMPNGTVTPATTNVITGADPNLIAAGYVTGNGAADWIDLTKRYTMVLCGKPAVTSSLVS